MSRGARQGILPFFIPHMGCPHQCVFCNQHTITEQEESALPRGKTVLAMARKAAEETQRRREESQHRREDAPRRREDAQHRREGAQYRREDAPRRRKEAVTSVSLPAIAFYGGTFTAIPAAYRQELLAAAQEAVARGWAQGIRCSTRPDDLGLEAVAELQRYGVDLVEIGVQSLSPTVLAQAERGHTRESVYEAVATLRKAGLAYGIQLMLGLPGDTWGQWVDTVVRTAALAPRVVRLYPTVVLEGTELAAQYEAGTYTPLTEAIAVAQCAFAKSYLEQRGITVIRTGLQATSSLDAGIGRLAGPYHPAFGELVSGAQWAQRIEPVLAKLAALYPDGETIRIRHRNALTSAVRGHKQCNRKRWEARYPGRMQWEVATETEPAVSLVCGRTKVIMV